MRHVRIHNFRVNKTGQRYAALAQILMSNQQGSKFVWSIVCPPVDLCFNFEKSSWKNQFRWTGFLGSKNQVRNRLKIQFVELNFSKLIFPKSSTDQQGVSQILFLILNYRGVLTNEVSSNVVSNNTINFSLQFRKLYFD